MREKKRHDRRMVLAGLGSAAFLGAASNPVQAQEGEPTLEAHGLNVTNDQPKGSVAVKPVGLKPTAEIVVEKYDRIDELAVFKGEVWINKKDNYKTFTFGDVSKGLAGGMFEGSYYLTKDDKDWYKYSPDADPLHGLWVQLVLAKNFGLVRYCYGRKRVVLPGWAWGAWKPLTHWVL